jgi:hypothetical protein
LRVKKKTRDEEGRRAFHGPGGSLFVSRQVW